MRESRRYDAVIFDLFGTLVPEWPREEFDEALGEMGTVLGLSAEGFVEAWYATEIEQLTGRLGDLEETIRALCDELGDAPTGEQVAEATAIRTAMHERYFHPQPEAVETARALHDRGYALGLVSMCYPDTPALWAESELARSFGVTVFSSETGLAKPDAEIYLAAAEGLGVDPARCLYVGDGSYGELAGAAAVGMAPVLIRDPEERIGAVVRPQADTWTGPSIQTLPDVLGII